MSDPKRLLDDADLGGTLLRAGRAVDAERARERRIAVLGGAAAIGAAATATAWGGVRLTLGKWLLLALAAGAAITVAALQLGAPRPPEERLVARRARAVLAAHALVTPAEAPAAPARAERSDAIDVASLPDVEPAREVARAPAAVPRREPPVAPSASPSASPGEGLAEEVASLQEARAALAAGALQRALASLDAHARRFPQGRLGLEAEVLRIEALARAGDHASAAARARAFAAAHPGSPYASRVRALAETNP